jgi:hypothetical protein
LGLCAALREFKREAAVVGLDILAVQNWVASPMMIAGLISG